MTEIGLLHCKTQRGHPTDNPNFALEAYHTAGLRQGVRTPVTVESPSKSLEAERNGTSETPQKAAILEGYLVYLADEKPELFVPLLGKLLPLQVRAKNEGEVPV
jgi:hypothetical protein